MCTVKPWNLQGKSKLWTVWKMKQVQCGTRTISNVKTLLHVPAALHLVDRCASCTYAVWNPKYTNIIDFDYSLVLSVALQRIHPPEPIPGHFLLWSSNKSHRLIHSQKSYESFWSLSNRSVYNEKFMRVLLHRWRERHGGSERKHRDVRTHAWRDNRQV